VRSTVVTILLSLLLWTLPAVADDGTKSAAALYREGNYQAAIATGASKRNAEELTAAAEAAFADATLRDEPCLDCLKRAEMLARSAIKADAAIPRAYVCLVATLAYESRVIGPLASRRARYPEEAKEAIDTALMLAPNDPWVLAAMGGWNIEVVRSGGSFLGRVMYGADLDSGIAYFRRAMATDLDDPTILLHYALAMSSVAHDSKRIEIIAVLEAATHAKPYDAYSDAMRDRAAGLLKLLRQDKREEYLALVGRYLGFPAGSSF
jgi:hypothetical protein